MRSLPRIVAFVLIGLVVSLPVLGADDKDKKADAKKDDTAKKADVTKPDAKKPDAKKDKDKDAEKEKPTEKWLTVATVVGTVKGVVEAKKSLRIELTNGKDKKEVEWQAIDDVKVRMVNPPAQFDDKGRIKKYTRKELRELKGDDKSPFYPAEFSDLKAEQIVRVTLVKKKGTPRVTPKRGKDADPDLLGDNLPHMSLIVIVAQPKP